MVRGKIQSADDADGVMPGLHAGELDAFAGVEQFAAGQMAEEIEMPPGAAEFAVGRELEAGGCLPVHHLLDLEVFGLAQIVTEISPFSSLARASLIRRRPQQAADLVGTERGFCSLHGLHSRKLFAILKSCTGSR